MKTVVLKFGGTSVATKEARERAVAHVKDYIDSGYAVAVVVSAMGRMGAPYATDTLLSLVRGEDTTPAARDLLMSCGETISACVFADALCASDIPAVPMNGMTAGIRTTDEHLQAHIIDMDTVRVMRTLKASRVAVITGFQGVDSRMNVETLGRGGSDTSAVAIAGFLRAEAAIIYTDVPGVAEADPRIVKEARFVGEIDSDDMHALASAGSGVIHPRAVEAGKRFNTAIYVRSNFDGEPGTLIRPMAEKPSGLIGVAVKKEKDVAQISVLARPLDSSALDRARTALGGASVTAEGGMLRATVPIASCEAAANALYRLFR